MPAARDALAVVGAVVVPLLLVALITVRAWLPLLYPDPISYRNVPFPVLQDAPIVAGQPIPLRVTRCNASGGPLTYAVTRRLRNLDTGEATDLLPTSSHMDATGCETITSKILVVPADTPSGRYELSGVSELDMGGVRRDVAWRTAPFDVVAPPGRAP